MFSLHTINVASANLLYLLIFSFIPPPPPPPLPTMTSYAASLLPFNSFCRFLAVFHEVFTRRGEVVMEV